MSRQLAFEPATARPLRPKILLFGDKGTTKTFTVLSLAKNTGAKLALIDTEDGSDTYAADFPFAALHTDDPVEVEAQVDLLLEEPGDYTLFAIDPITQVHDRLLDMADAELRAHREKTGRKPRTFEGVLEPGAHRRIGQISKVLQQKIRRLDLAVIVTAHEAIEYESSATRSGSLALKKVGTKPEGHKSLGYWFDLVLRLERIGTVIVARVEKARGMPIEIGDTIEEFNAEKLAELFPEGAFTRQATARPVVTEEQAIEIHALIDRANLEPWQINKALTHYGASCVELLAREHAEAIVSNLKRLNSRQGSSKQ